LPGLWFSSQEILALLNDFRAAGVHKFVLRPLAQDSADVMQQTERLIDEVLPVVKAMNGSDSEQDVA